MRAILCLAAALAVLPARAADEAPESPFSEASKSYVIPAVEIIAFDALLNQFDRHYFGCCDFDSNIHSIRRNLRTSWVVDRDPFLSRIDGLVFGDNPEDGIVRGNLFLHPPLRFAIEFPDGWEITNSDEQVVAQEPGNKIFMVLRTIEPRPGRSLDQIAQQHMRDSGYKTAHITSATIAGLPAVVGTYQGNASGIGQVSSRGAHITLGRSTYFIGGIAAPDMYPRVLAAFDKAIQSFRQLSQDEADAIEPNVVDLYVARQGDTWQSIAQRAGGGLVSARTLAIMNDHAIDQQPEPGTRLKIVVAGS